MKLLKTFCMLLAVIAVFGAAMFGLNCYTGPLIKNNEAAANSGPLAEVMPDGAAFEEIDITTVEGLPATVTKIHKETSGKGYVFEVTVDSGYQPGMVILCGIDAEGKITGSKCTKTNDTYGLEEKLNGQYNGKMLDDVDLIIAAGASPNSMTSKAYFEAIEAALQANVLVGGGELGPEMVFKNMLPSIVPAFSKLKEVTVTSDKVVKAFATMNDSAFAYVMAEGENYFMAVVNTMGACTVYNAEKADVTADHAALVTEAKALVSTTKEGFESALKTNIETLMPGAAEITTLELNSFSTVVCAASFKVEGATYYAFYTKPLSYEDSAMAVYTVLDANGAIVKQNVAQMAFGHGVEYIPGIRDYTDVNSQTFKDYLEKFNGITSDSLSDNVLISGATISSSAVKLGTADAFAAFNSINNGGAQQ